MRIISKSAIRAFVKERTNDRLHADRDLSAWFKLAEESDWADVGELKQTFGSADVVGRCMVFDVGNNRFRLIARVFFETRKIYILKVMDHKEYDRQRWIKECQCHEPKPLWKLRKKRPQQRKPREK